MNKISNIAVLAAAGILLAIGTTGLWTGTALADGDPTVIEQTDQATPPPVVIETPEPVATMDAVAPCAPSRQGCPTVEPKPPVDPCYATNTCPHRDPVPPVTYPHYVGDEAWEILGADQDPCHIYLVRVHNGVPQAVEADDRAC